MANVDDVSKLKVDQLKELAAQHNVELADGDKKDDLVLKVADGITSEQLEAYNNKSNDGSSESDESTEDEDSSDDNAHDQVGELPSPETDVEAPLPEQETPANEQAAADIEKSGVQGTDVEGSTVNENAGEGEPDAVSEGANDEDQTVAVQADGIDGVDRDHTPNTEKPEEAAAARAGVPEERLDNEKQNREPKNDFEQENQKVTEVERQAAQEASDMTTAERVESAPTPAEQASKDAADTASTIAAAIAQGLKGIGKDEGFELQEEVGIDHRFSVVRSKATGEVMLRDNGDGSLSKVQLESLEEKEASIQNTEVEEL